MPRPPVQQVVALGAPPWPTIDPFLFCVHHVDRYPRGDGRLGPDAPLDGRPLGQDFGGIDGWRMYHGTRVPGFPQHPHRGFETVTSVRRGLVDHADSLGATARYGAGDVQWLTAGRGLNHSEMFPLVDDDGPNPLELFQIWLNLPAAEKLVEPGFTMLWDRELPRLRVATAGGPAAEVVVVAGALGDLVPPPPPPASWAARADSHVAIWHVHLDAGAAVELPATVEGVGRVLYLAHGGGLAVGAEVLPAGHAAVLDPTAPAALEAADGAVEALVLQGRPIGEPVFQAGPFVMADRASLEQAFHDYRRTAFGGWPWDTEEPVHGRSERFAQHVDGRRELAVG